MLLLRDDGQKPAHDSMGCHIYNFGRSASARCYFHKMCLQMVASGVIDGCGADASQAMGGDADGSRWQISAQELAAWRSGHQQMLAELPGLLGNGVLLGDVDCPGCDWGALPTTATGVHSEHCAPNNETINGLRRAGREHPGKIVQCHFTEDRSGMGQDVHHSIAAFLIGMSEHHYWGVGFWDNKPEYGGQPDFSDHWVADVYDRQLGQPNGDGVYNARTGEWSRGFGMMNGRPRVTVFFDTTTNLGNILWG